MTLSANAMRCTAHNLQVTVLKAVNYQWRERVYMSVPEGKDTFPPEDEYYCVLGRWYHGKGRTAFGLLPAFVRLGMRTADFIWRFQNWCMNRAGRSTLRSRY